MLSTNVRQRAWVKMIMTVKYIGDSIIIIITKEGAVGMIYNYRMIKGGLWEMIKGHELKW